MRPASDVLGGRPRKDLGHTNPAPPLGHNTIMPTSFRMATEKEIEGSSTKASESRSDSNYGVQSLQDTIYQSASKESSQDGDDADDNDGDDLGRRRSTLKPKPSIRTRDDSRESIKAPQINTGDSSPSHLSQERQSPPSMSQSMASLASISLNSQAPLSSPPSSLKSTSNRSFRQSDEESIDEASQAIVSSEEDEVEPHSEITDSVPQLVMPSIKMPSRRPFTERGKGMGRLKVLIAGDSGRHKTSGSVHWKQRMLIILRRRRQDLSHQVYCTDL